MRVIGLMASHCTELRDNIPVTEVRRVCKDGRFNIKTNIFENTEKRQQVSL